MFINFDVLIFEFLFKFYAHKPKSILKAFDKSLLSKISNVRNASKWHITQWHNSSIISSFG
jgi:hypothetical protein